LELAPKELILNFHGLGEPHSSIDPAELRYWWDEGPFCAMLDALCSANCTGTSILITFDDGNSSDVRIALPALMQRNLKARFFVCAGRIGMRNYLDRSAILELIAAGMGVGSHGMKHVDWTLTSADDLHKETFAAKSELEDICGCLIEEIAIPFGSYNRRVVTKLREMGLRCVYTSDGGYARANDWLKPRNTLDRTWQGRDVMNEIRMRQGLTSRIKKFISRRYKLMC
jgi:peptidoglycan/xylan/chitin deacetylase (PgdA/CDA1 family)